jgi:hypothetical protein
MAEDEEKEESEKWKVERGRESRVEERRRGVFLQLYRTGHDKRVPPDDADW